MAGAFVSRVEIFAAILLDASMRLYRASLSSVLGRYKMSVVVADLSTLSFVGDGGVMGGVGADALCALIICSYMLSVVGRIVITLMEAV